MTSRIILTTTDGNGDIPLGFETSSENPGIVEIYFGKRLITACDQNDFFAFLKDAQFYFDTLKKHKML